MFELTFNTKALAKEGADIVVAARRMEPVEQTAKEALDLGRRRLAISTDVTDSRQVNRLVERTLSEMGRISKFSIKIIV